MSIARQMMMAAGAAGAGGGGLQSATVAYSCHPNNDRFNSVDITSASSITLLQTYSNTTQLDNPIDVVIDAENNLAFVAGSANDRVVSFDISDPAAMAPVDYIAFLKARCVALDVDRKIVFAAYSNSLIAISYTQSGALTEISRITNASLYSPVAMVLNKTDNTLYLSCGSYNYFVSVSVSDPNNMVKLGEYTNINTIQNAGMAALDLEAQVAYVPGGRTNTGYLTTIDISDPTALTYVTSKSIAPSYQGACAAFDPVNRVAYMTSLYGDSIFSFNATNPASLVELDEYASTTLNGAQTLRLDLISNIAYVQANVGSALTAIDISNPNNLVELGSLTASQLALGFSFAINSGGNASTNAYP